jgi:NAD(P)-dependent dehydrogenase (short-subunit alcohol dehydrogenase family)
MTSNRRWFITGTSTGIGRELARALIARGERVAATARNPEALSDLDAWTAPLDVTDPDQIRETFAAATEELGGIDVVVNNAGYAMFGAAEEVADEELRRALDTNLLGGIRVTKAALPVMREQGGGHIIQMSSAGGQIATPGFSSYNCSKWGLEGFSEALAQEVAGFGIKVTVIEPGGVLTDFASRSMKMAEPLPAYAETPYGQVRGFFESGPVESQMPGHPAKVAAAVIDVADRDPAPIRLTLGSDAYASVGDALRGRLEALKADREITLSTDRDQGADTDAEMNELLFQRGADQ